MIPLYVNKTRIPLLTLMIVVINITVFVIMLYSGEQQFFEICRNYGIVNSGEIRLNYNLITYSLIHADIEHIVINMILLWVMGSILESNMSSIEYLIFILTSTILVAIIFMLFSECGRTTLVGISGVIFAMMGYILIKYREYSVKMYVFPVFLINMEIINLIAILVLVQILMFIGVLGSDVNFISHVTGMIFGVMIGLVSLVIDGNSTI